MNEREEFKQLILHYYRIAFERAGVPRRVLKEDNKADIYREDEWNKLSEVTGIELKKLRQWRSEYERFKNGIDTLHDLANVGQFDDLIDFLYVFYRKDSPPEMSDNIDELHWSHRFKKDMETLNTSDMDHRIKLSSFISFTCNMKDEELRDKIIDTIMTLISRLDKNSDHDQKRIINTMDLFRKAIGGD